MDYSANLKAAVAALQQWYNPSSGLWKSGWWQSAEALHALIDYIARSGDTTYQSVIANTFSNAQKTHKDFINNYYDDCQWWALSWLAAYDLTDDSAYLREAEKIFSYVTGGWDKTFSGGVWWRTDKAYKNAVTNELFLELSARLYRRTNKKVYLDWASREYAWFTGSGMIGPQGLVNDGLNSSGQNNGGTTWTYNQGVILSGLGDLYLISRDSSCLAVGSDIANATLFKLTRNGILIEPCEVANNCNSDQTQFKGIFIAGLYDFCQDGADQSSVLAWQDFILANAASLVASDTDGANHYGIHWAGPFDAADAGRQTAALQLLNAAMPLAK